MGDPIAGPVLLASDFLVRYMAGLARGLGECGRSVIFMTRTHDLEFGGEPGAMRSYVREIGRAHV